MKKYVELLPAVAPLKPTLWHRRRLDFLMCSLGWLARLGLSRFVKKVEVVGREHLQGKGPLLILMNHSSAFDPALLACFGRVASLFLVTEPFMADRKISRLAAWLGQIPKRKLDPDTRSIRTMKEWCKVGGKVATFPEGQFPWDGNPLPLQPGLKELVSFLDVPVVTVRLINGDRLWPAWAKYPRTTSLRMEIDPPKKFTPDELPGVESYVADRLRVDPLTCMRFPVTGHDFADGISRFLRFCFGCGSDGSLSDSGNELCCSACKGIWKMDGESFLPAKAWADVKSQLKKKWAAGVTLQSQGTVKVFDATRPQWVEITEGALTFENSNLTVGEWSLPRAEIMAHTMDWGDLILLRTKRQRLAIRFPNDSRAVWTEALDHA